LLRSSEKAVYPARIGFQLIDDIWEYYEAHKDELEDLDVYAKKRGLVRRWCKTRQPAREKHLKLQREKDQYVLLDAL
jgi:hypothetical protein